LVDDEGVPGRETVLVQKGILKTLLSTRTPVRGILQSNGHKRGNAAAPSNLIVTSEKALGDEELRAELIRLIKQRNKEYGIVVRRMASRPGSALNALINMLGLPAAAAGANIASMAFQLRPDQHDEVARDDQICGA